MMRLVFHPALSFEVKASYDWYEDKTQGLGDDFLSELELGFQAIIEYPDTWPVFTKRVRRFILSRFPYSILYQITPDMVHVVAVMHNSRKPGYCEMGRGQAWLVGLLRRGEKSRGGVRPALL